MADEADDLDLARRGDRDAFGRLVRRHHRRVYAAALHILGNHSDADDVTQEAFVRAYRGLGSFDGRAALGHLHDIPKPYCIRPISRINL